MKAKIKEITGLRIKAIRRLTRGAYVRFYSEMSAYKAFVTLCQAGYGAIVSPDNNKEVYIKGAFKPLRKPPKPSGLPKLSMPRFTVTRVAHD